MDAVGQVSVSGPDSRWQIANQLIVGNGGIGQLTIEDHGQVTCANGVVGNQATANGTITISGAGANLVSTGSFNLGAAGPGVLTLVDGGAVEGHPFTVSSFGTLSGVGTVTGALVNNHLVQPGASPGVLSVAGSYNQGTAGTLEMEIAGPAAGSEHDLLAVSGAVALSGTLQLNFLDGYTPLPGTQFDLLTAGSISGQFSAVTPCNETFRIDYLADRVRLTIVDWAATLHEGFESGDFSAQPWIQGGNQPWLLQNSLQHSGCFGAKSGAISHNQTSTLSLTQTVASESSISFWYQVSSQLNGDFLRFSIDGVQLGAWSGTVGWTQANYPVGPGTHTYQWAYTKNASVNTGSDCAWVDEILLPDLGDPQYPDYTTSITAIESTVIAGSQAEVPVTLGNTGVAALNWVASFSTVGVPTALEYMELEKGAEDPRVGTVSRSAGGPDAFGYRWRDSNQPDGPAYGWVDIQAVGTSPGIGDDTSFGPVALGFPFMFYGNTYNSVRITSNGNLSFTSSSTQHTNQGIPNGAAPNDMIAVFWDDLNVTTPSMLKYFADTANQRFIVQWTAVPRYNTAQFQTFQTILHSDGRIENHYQTVSGANSCTVGIENFAGTDGLQVVANANFLTDGLAIEFYPVEPWLSLTPGAGTVPAGGSADFLVTIDAASLAQGSHDALVTVDSNDPDQPRLTLPVHVIVSVLEAPVLAIDFTAPDQVQLSWPAVPGATHYQVYSSTDGGASYSLLASTSELTSSLTVSAAETRLFQVRAVR